MCDVNVVHSAAGTRGSSVSMVHFIQREVELAVPCAFDPQIVFHRPRREVELAVPSAHGQHLRNTWNS